jgi:hypothetical protein
MQPASLTRLSRRQITAVCLTPDSYLTDGQRLLRVVSQFDARAENAFACLEDCRTLEVRPYSPGELDAMRLRPVARSASA